ncbi:MAG: InlB B-repeat-containing protein [Clostridia bacterium]|nr:InlB B-repeat-containing protein [Clostridia bacterium]
MGDLVIDDVEPGADLDGADMDAPDAGEETSADGGIAMASYYAVTFDTQGGEPVPELQMVEEGGYAQRPEDPTRDRSAFTGWFLNGEDYFANPTPINSDVTLTAGWEVEQLEQEVGDAPEVEPEQQSGDEIEIVDQPEEEGQEGGETGAEDTEEAEGQETTEAGEVSGEAGTAELYEDIDTVTEDSADAVQETDVAKIGDTGYETIDDAITNAVDGDTIILLKDLERGASKIAIKGKTLTIDLNGHTISGTTTGMITLSKNGPTSSNVTIMDTAGNGGVTTTATGSVLSVTGTLAIEGGTFTPLSKANAQYAAVNTCAIVESHIKSGSSTYYKMKFTSNKDSAHAKLDFTTNGKPYSVYVGNSDTNEIINALIGSTATSFTVEFFENTEWTYDCKPAFGPDAGTLKSGELFYWTGSITLNDGVTLSGDIKLKQAKITVKDTAENGSFSAKNGIGIETKAATATVNVLSGNITGTTYGISTDNAAVNVRGGTVIGTDIGIRTQSGAINVSGGTVSGGNHGIKEVRNEKPAAITITGGTIQATGSETGTRAIKLEDATTLTISEDAGNVKIKGGQAGIALYSAADVTIKAGNITASAYGIVDYKYAEAAQKAEITITGGKISVSETGSDSGGIILENDTTLKVSQTDGTVTIDGGHAGIAVLAAANVTVEGGTISGINSGITGNGSTGKGGYTINVNGGTVKASDGIGIYHPNTGTLNISNGSVSGNTAIYVKSGVTNISGGTLIGSGNKVNYRYVSSGADTTGDALVVDNCGYPGGAPEVTISGGTFTSTNNRGIGSYFSNPATTLAHVHANSNNITIHDASVDTQWHEIWVTEESGYKLVQGWVVTFKDGEAELSKQEVESGQKATEPSPAPTKTGYTFKEWQKDELAYDFNTSVTADITLTAKWTANTYTVAFDKNGGTGTMDSQSFTYDEAKTLTDNAFTRTGYAFDSWNTKDDGTGDKYADKASVKNLTAKANGTVTLYAQWKANTYTVVFNNNGGTGTMVSQSFTYDVEKALTANSFTRTGYAFNGWNTAADGKGTAYTDKQKVKNLASTNGASVTLYAQWKVNQYTITFNTDGGSKIDPITKDYGAAVTAPADPTRTGYEFTGWDTTIPTTMPAENLTVTAQWRPHVLTVKFDANGGDGTMAAVTLSYGEEKSLPVNAFTRDYYTFAGWSEQKNGGNTGLLKDKDKLTNDANQDKEITLYAQWTANRYTITFNTDGGSAIDAITLDYGAKVTAPTAPTKAATPSRHGAPSCRGRCRGTM